LQSHPRVPTRCLTQSKALRRMRGRKQIGNKDSRPPPGFPLAELTWIQSASSRGCAATTSSSSGRVCRSLPRRAERGEDQVVIPDVSIPRPICDTLETGHSAILPVSDARPPGVQSAGTAKRVSSSELMELRPQRRRRDRLTRREGVAAGARLVLRQRLPERVARPQAPSGPDRSAGRRSARRRRRKAVQNARITKRRGPRC
jgi:hypothetical protein